MTAAFGSGGIVHKTRYVTETYSQVFMHNGGCHAIITQVLRLEQLALGTMAAQFVSWNLLTPVAATVSFVCETQ